MTVNLRAKFRCTSKKQYESPVWDAEHKTSQPGFVYAYEFQVVTGGSSENNAFYASTPTGTLMLGAVRDDLFVPGQSYYLDFTPAESA